MSMRISGNLFSIPGRGTNPWRCLLALFCLLAAWLMMPGNAATAGAAEQEEAFDRTLEQAQILLRQRNYEDALKAFKRANKIQKEGCVECLWGMARAYEGLGAFKNVIDACEKIIPLAANDAKTLSLAYNMKGLSLLSLSDGKDEKKLREAEASFRSALDQNQNAPIIHFNLGVILMKLNRDAEGIEQLKTYVAKASAGSVVNDARRMIENPRRAREDYAPEFTLTTVQGEYIDSEDLRGKVVVVDFWGTWCPPCVASIPSLVSLNKKFSKEPFVLISVSSDNDEATWRAFVEKNKMTWPQFLDARDKIQEAFRVRSFPTCIVIDHEGVVRHRSSGYGLWTSAEIEGAIKKSLKALAKAGLPSKTQPAAASTPVKTAESAPARPAAAAPPATLPEAKEVREAASKDASELPTPVLELVAVDSMEAGGMTLTRYLLRVKNWVDYPDALFESVPDLPPCGPGTAASRVQVQVQSEGGSSYPIVYCNLRKAEMLQRLWFVVRAGDPPPSRVYLTLEDRVAKHTVKSNAVALPIPQPN